MQSRYRLKSRKSYTYIYNNGKTVHKDALSLISVHSKYGIKFGFSASKKVGGAVVRNKVRRRLKEIVRALLPKIAENRNYIVLARPDAAKKTFDELSSNVVALLEKAGVIKQ